VDDLATVDPGEAEEEPDQFIRRGEGAEDDASHVCGHLEQRGGDAVSVLGTPHFCLQVDAGAEFREGADGSYPYVCWLEVEQGRAGGNRAGATGCILIHAMGVESGVSAGRAGRTYGGKWYTTMGFHNGVSVRYPHLTTPSAVSRQGAPPARGLRAPLAALRPSSEMSGANP
jgi:hypothetical protein